VRVLETILRLLHPITPYITEEAWQTVAPLAGKDGDTIMLQPYPTSNEALEDELSEKELEWVKHVIMGVRKIRSEMDIAPGKKLSILLSNLSDQDKNWLNRNKVFLQTLAKLEDITLQDNEDEAPESAVALVVEMKILIPMAGLIDKDAEMARLDKEISRLEGEVKRFNGKLSNESFVSKAPAAVVEKEKQKLQDTEIALKNLKDQYAKISQI
jgi:valyl-tRNA synthetase